MRPITELFRTIGLDARYPTFATQEVLAQAIDAGKITSSEARRMWAFGDKPAKYRRATIARETLDVSDAGIEAMRAKLAGAKARLSRNS